MRRTADGWPVRLSDSTTPAGLCGPRQPRADLLEAGDRAGAVPAAGAAAGARGRRHDRSGRGGARGPREFHPTGAGVHQPPDERARCRGPRATQGDPHLGYGRRRGGGDRGRRYRARDPARARAADLRSLLHDQGGRERHGSGPLHYVWDHQGARRHDLGRERARRRRCVPDPPAPHARRHRGDLRRMTPSHVLIVDDDPALLQALPEALKLRMSELMVDTADSAAAALDRIAAQDYNAIVTDIKMPGMDGFALLDEIRARRPDTPTLMITGHGERALAAKP